MAVILHIETATGNCSVSLGNDEQLLSCIELNEGYTHAENLHPFIDQLLKQTHLKPADLHAVAVSAGPGSYTGLRIGVSAAKGICYALNVPLISLNTLQILSAGAVNLITQKNVLLCAMLDARRMEVYSAVYDHHLNEVIKPDPLIISDSSIKPFDTGKPIYFFGDGMPKCKDLLKSISNSNFIDNLVPSSANMLKLAFSKYKNKQFEDIAYFEPLYLKEYLFKTK